MDNTLRLLCCYNMFQKVLSDVTQHCEYHIGTEGGGMDQAISFLAQKGTVSIVWVHSACNKQSDI